MRRLKPIVFLGSALVCFLGLSQAFAATKTESLIDLRSGDAIEIDLAKSQNHRVFVFISSACPCSTSHTDFLNELYRKYSSQGFDFIGLHPNGSEEREDAISFYSKNFAFPVLDDSDQKITRHFKAAKTPQVFVVSPEGETVYLGAVSNSRKEADSTEHYLDVAINQILSGKKPKPSARKSLGCSIERI